MKSVLLNANNDRGWKARYQATLDIARAFSSHLLFVQSTPFFEGGDNFFGYFPYPEIAHELAETARQHRKLVEAELPGEGVTWDWQEWTGDPETSLVRYSALADVVVISSAGPLSGEPASADLALAGGVCTHARGPVLAVPPQAARFDPVGTALVAWNGSPEGANALRLSLPMLSKAAKVFLVTVTENESADDDHDFPPTEASEYLARHDIVSELHCWERDKREVADVLLDAAATLGADYIVAGAYGHSRFREAVLGGVTRALLCRASVPVLMAH